MIAPKIFPKPSHYLTTETGFPIIKTSIKIYARFLILCGHGLYVLFNGSNSDLKLNAILEKNDNSFLVLSNEKINIDPFDLKSIHLNVVSDDTSDMDLSFRLTFKDGERGTGANLPISFTTSNPYPNPFKNEISFSVTVLKETFISITIFDLLGREIRYIYDESLGNNLK